MTTIIAAESDQFAVQAPADGTVLDRLPVDDEAVVADVVAALRNAQRRWAALPVRERVRWLARFRDWLYDHEAEINDLLAAETGKPVAEVGIELSSSLSVLRYYSSNAARFLGDETPRPSSALTALKKLRVRRVPHEVVGVISPWNFPVAMCLWDAIPALLAGCSVVIKPSEHTPLTTNLIVRGWHETGAPPVLAVVNGAGATGAAVVDHVDHVHFTGSTRTGTLIAARAAERLTSYSLELGGNDPAIVLADADLDLTAAGLVFNGMVNSGQMCVAVERVYAVAEVYDDLVAKVVERVAALRSAGDGFARDMSGLITAEQFAIVADHVQQAQESGATVPIGGTPGSGPHFPPTVLTDVDHTMKVMTEETFGPVLPIMRVADVDEAVRLSNDSPYGLSASVWSRNHREAVRVAERLEAGTVNVNDAATHILCHPIPQSGWKQSGSGARLGGAQGIRKFTRTQAITVNRVDLPVVTALAGYPYSAAKSGLLGAVGRLSDGGSLRNRLGLASPDVFTVRVRRWIEADPADVHAWLLDSSNYARVIPGVLERRVRDGHEAPYDVGTVRELISPLGVIREELTAVTEQSISYLIVGSPVPLTHRGADVTVTASGSGTAVEWTSRIAGGPLQEAVLGRALSTVFGLILDGCRRELGT